MIYPITREHICANIRPFWGEETVFALNGWSDCGQVSKNCFFTEYSGNIWFIFHCYWNLQWIEIITISQHNVVPMSHDTMFTSHSNRKAPAGGTAAELERVNKCGWKKYSFFNSEKNIIGSENIKLFPPELFSRLCFPRRWRSYQ